MDVMRKNGAFLEEVIKHLTRRYGVREVETWHFEMEKNSVVQEEIPIETYLDAFDVVAGILRTYVPRVRLGGAGFCLNYMGKEFPLILKKWKKHRQQPDFISIYSYPYIFDRDLLDAGRSDYSPDVDYLARQIQEARQIMEAQGFGDKELYVTEWSSTLSNRNCLNDSCFKSAYILRNLIQNYDRADAIAYWSATDILAESIESQTLLFGGCGLISRDGIRKPAYFAYEYMDYLGKYMLKRNQNALISGNESGVFFICCHNFKAFNFRYYTQDESKIEVENQRRLFEDNESMQMTFRFHHVNNGEYVIKIFSVNQENGNVQQEWKRLDYFSELAIPEIEYLKTLCQPRLTIHSAKAEDHTLVVETRLEAQEIQGIVIAEM